MSIEAEDLPVNTALLQLIPHNGIVDCGGDSADSGSGGGGGSGSGGSTDEIQSTTTLLSSLDKDQWLMYKSCRKCVQDLALFLKMTGGVPLLSRPMQRKRNNSNNKNNKSDL